MLWTLERQSPKNQEPLEKVKKSRSYKKKVVEFLSNKVARMHR